MIKEKTKARLALVRHGESLWNKKGWWTGWQDILLTEKGKKEAKNAAAVLHNIKFHLAVTSDLKRAYHTLEIIKKELNLTNLTTIKHEAYKERHYGIYTGKNKWEIKKYLGKDDFQNIRRGWNTPIPEGESLKDVYNRVIPHFEREILPQITTGLNILMVTHGNTNRVIMKYLEKISDEDIAAVEIATGEVIVYKINKKGGIIHKERRNINIKKGKQ